MTLESELFDLGRTVDGTMTVDPDVADRAAMQARRRIARRQRASRLGALGVIAVIVAGATVTVRQTASPEPADRPSTRPTGVPAPDPDVVYETTWYDPVEPTKPDHWGTVSVRRFDARTGAELAGIDAERLRDDPFLGAIALDDGRRVLMARNRFTIETGRCQQYAIYLIETDGSFTRLPALPSGRRMAVSRSGKLLVARDICPGGAEWGTDGTISEVVTADLADPTATPRVVVSVAGTRRELLDVPTGGGTYMSADTGVNEVRISPDGQRYAIEVSDDAPPEADGPPAQWFAGEGLYAAGELGSDCSGSPRFAAIEFGPQNELLSIAWCRNGRNGPIFRLRSESAGVHRDVDIETDFPMASSDSVTGSITPFRDEPGTYGIRLDATFPDPVSRGLTGASWMGLIQDSAITRFNGASVGTWDLGRSSVVSHVMKAVSLTVSELDDPGIRDFIAPFPPGTRYEEAKQQLVEFLGPPTSDGIETVTIPTCDVTDGTLRMTSAEQRVVRFVNVAYYFAREDDGEEVFSHWKLAAGGPVIDGEGIFERSVEELRATWPGLATGPDGGLAISGSAGQRIDLEQHDGWVTAASGPFPATCPG